MITFSDLIDAGLNLGGYRTFNSLEERKTAFKKIAVDSGALTLKDAEVLIRKGFLDSPASTKYHGSYWGGLFDHSYSVACTLRKLTKQLELDWDDLLSPIRIGLLHDLCKMDQYLYDEEKKGFSYDKNTLLVGHGIKSVVIAQSLPDTKLTEEEIACITYHMGAFTEKEEWTSYTNAVHKYPNVLWTHTADMLSSHVLELQ